MGLTQIGLVALAMSLSQNPSGSDLQKYQSLTIPERATVEAFIDGYDTIPEALEDLIKSLKHESLADACSHPSTESTELTLG